MPTYHRAGERPDAQADHSASSKLLERPEKLWLEDGSVVLQAENVQFKVHRSILTKHSQIFADLFKMPHPPTEPTVEGCPVVLLQDSAEDVKHVLLILYGDREYASSDEPPQFPVIAAMIRLGRKYEIAQLKDDALALLKKAFPTTLDNHSEYVWETHLAFPEDPVYDHDGKMLAAVLRLAHECNIQSILPSLFLQFLTMDLGTIFCQPNDLAIPYGALRRCMYGRDKLLEARSHKVFRWMRDIGYYRGCKNNAKCSTASRVLEGYIWDSPLGPVASAFYTWDAFKEDLTEDGALDELCDHCLRCAKSSHEQGRSALWDMLPMCFELPPWGDLKDDM